MKLFKSYYFNFLNGLFIFFTYFIYCYLLYKKLLINLYQFESGSIIDHNIQEYIFYIRYIVIICFLGYLILLFSIYFSNILKNSFKEAKIIKYFLIFGTILFMFGIIYRYNLLVNYIFNFKRLDYSEIFYYFGKYLILNSMATISISAIAFVLLKDKKYFIILLQLIYIIIFIILYTAIQKPTIISNSFAVLFLIISNISLGFLEKNAYEIKGF